MPKMWEKKLRDKNNIMYTDDTVGYVAGAAIIVTAIIFGITLAGTDNLIEQVSNALVWIRAF